MRPTVTCLRTFVVLFVLLTSATPMLGQQPAQPTPQPPISPSAASGEPTSVQETYQDWIVMCAQREGKKVCALTQQQLDKDSRQRVVAVEVNNFTAEKAEGTLVLPFGLAVSREVTLQIDGVALGAPLHFRTCVAAGCLVSLSFDTQSVTTLKKGTALAVNASADGGKPVSFTLSLKGFANAFDRTAALVK